MLKGLYSIFTKPHHKIKTTATESDLSAKHTYFLEQGLKMCEDSLAGRPAEQVTLDYLVASLHINKESINWNLQSKTSKDNIITISYDRTYKALEHAFIRLFFHNCYHYLDCSDISTVKDISRKMTELDSRQDIPS